MLEFDQNGLLMPSKNIACTVDELKQYFVDAIPSETRLPNFERYIHYSNELKKLLGVIFQVVYCSKTGHIDEILQDGSSYVSIV